jgi:hypothetical protein
MAGPMVAPIRRAWRSWLAALAADAEAALAAALTYEALPGEVRDAWLDAVDAEAWSLDVPVIAFYGPLLGVESDPARIERMRAVVAADPASASAPSEPLAWMGVAASGVHACIVAFPLYLDYVREIVCRYTPEGGFVAAAHDPLRRAAAPLPLRDVEGVAVERTPLPLVVDELAHAVLAHKRRNEAPPPALQWFLDLFVPEARWMVMAPALACGSQVV